MQEINHPVQRFSVKPGCEKEKSFNDAITTWGG